MDTIKVGEIWKCIKTVHMENSGEIAYVSGNLYLCEVENCLTDVEGCKKHVISSSKFLAEHFEKFKKVASTVSLSASKLGFQPGDKVEFFRQPESFEWDGIGEISIPLDTPIDRELLANAFNVNDFVRVSYWPDQVQGLRYSRHFDLTGHYRVSACVKSTVMVEDKYGERVQVPVKYLTKVYNASPIDTYYPPKPEECNLPDLHKTEKSSTFDTEIERVKDLSNIKLFKPSKNRYS